MANSDKTMVMAERSSLIFQGGLAILFGIAAVFWPGLTVEILVFLFGAFLLVDGVVHLTLGLMDLKNMNKSLMALVLGLAQLGVGLYLFRNPDVSFDTLILILGFSLIVRGLVSFVRAFFSESYAALKTHQGIMGALGVVIGVIILLQPESEGLAFVWLLGLYALIVGPVMVAMAADLEKAR